MESYSWIQLNRPVPYRVAQKTADPYLAIVVRACPTDFELNAPPILAVKNSVTFLTDDLVKIDDPVKALRIADEIMVTEIQIRVLNGNGLDFYTFCDGSYLLEPQGIIWNASLRSKTTLTTELAYICRTIYENGRNNIWLMDRATQMEYQVPNERFPNFPESKKQPGTLVRVHSIHYPAGTLVSASHDLVLHPYCTSEIVIPNMTRLDCDIRDTVWVQCVSNPDPNEFVEHFLASYSLMEMVHSRDSTDALNMKLLTWNFMSEENAEMTYFIDFSLDLKADISMQSKNGLFLKNAIVSFRRFRTDGYFSSPVFIRIKTASYKENSTKIVFHVDPDYLMKIWGLTSFVELEKAKYQIEPSALLWHLTDYYKRMLEDEAQFLDDLNFAADRNNILEPFLAHKSNVAVQPRKRSMFAEIDEDNRRKEDHRLSFNQKEAINAIVEGKPFVVVDGPAKSGKTTVSTFAIPGILQEQVCSVADRCLFVVGEVYHLEQLLARLNKQNEFLRVCNEFDVRLLNLLDLQNPDPTNQNSLTGVINFLLENPQIPVEEYEMLENCLRILYSKFQTERKIVEETNSGGLENEMDQVSLGGSDYFLGGIRKRKISSLRFFTSAEFEVFQSAIVLVFRYFCPKIVLVDQKTLVSVLPIIKNEISHVFVENAGIVPFFDIFAIVKEAKYLRQLVLIGDKFQNPTFSRVFLDNLPKFFDSVLNGIDLAHSNIIYFQFNHIFHLHPGIIKILQQVFYKEMKIQPYLKLKSINSRLIRNVDFPIVFYDMVGEDKLLFSSTRTNTQHSKVTEMLVEKLLNYRPDLTIDILCYYSAQLEDVRFILEKNMPNGFPSNIRLMTIDSVCDDRPDISIIITTRTLNLKTFPMKYHPVNHQGQHYLKRVRIGLDESKKLFSPDDYRYLFDKQRMIKGLSHAEKTCFIIGSYELLREDSKWDQLLDAIHQHGNFIEEPPFLPEKGKRYDLVTPPQNLNPSVILNGSLSSNFILVDGTSRNDLPDSIITRKRPRVVI